MSDNLMIVPEDNKEMVARIQGRVNTIQHVFRSIMKVDSDYGKIPGCGDKPTLLKPGSEKLMMAFQVAPSLKIERRDHENGQREYEVVTTLTGPGGVILGEGVGCCSTMESKYRWRTGPKEFTGKAVPKEYWTMRKNDPIKAQQLIGGPGHSVGKNEARGDMWEVCTKGEKVENTDPADQYNTVLKMAKKRSIVDACLTVFGASDIFTQDIEDMGSEPPKTAQDGNKTKTDKALTPAEKYTALASQINDAGKAAQDEAFKVQDEYLNGKNITIAEMTEDDYVELNIKLAAIVAKKG